MKTRRSRPDRRSRGGAPGGPSRAPRRFPAPAGQLRGCRAAWALGCAFACLAASPRCPGGEDPAPRSVESIAGASKDAIVVIHGTGRDGKKHSLGTGFVIRSDGLIATNFHVIGPNRPFSVQLAGGKSFEPISIEGADRIKDLALVRIQADGLTALPLGDSDGLRPGQSVLAVGNPLGLEFSVSQGVIAAQREVDGRPLIQVAMPLEPGSSGSPVIDLQGKVVGILSIKTAAALGFAVPVNELKTLLASPRSVTMARWLTIGALDAAEWESRMGGHWRQRAGIIIATGQGDGFGGRMVCIARQPPPAGPFELEVEVRLGDESGAAGLCFHDDGKDTHYGFYATAGSLRLTRFEGPDVFSWTTLKTVPSALYHPGEWNRLRARVDNGRLTCSVNGSVAIDLEDAALSGGGIGLVKFREPQAEFRGFRAGKELPSAETGAEQAAEIAGLLEKLPPGGEPPDDVLNRLAAAGSAGGRILRAKAGDLDRQAARLRELAARVHQLSVLGELKTLADAGDNIDLLRGALLIARLDNADLDVEAYLRRFDRMGKEALSRLPEKAGDPEKLAAVIAYLYEDLGFHGSHLDYYHRSNSYINEVLDDREGIPITLALVLVELGRRAGLPLHGLGVPRHFLVLYRPAADAAGDAEKLIDAFDGGKVLGRKEAEALCGEPLGDADIKPASKKSILVRMLHNLLNAAEHENDAPGAMRYLDAILSIDGDSAADRWLRATRRIQGGEAPAAIEDLDWLIERGPPGFDAEQLRRLKERIQEGR